MYGIFIYLRGDDFINIMMMMMMMMIMMTGKYQVGSFLIRAVGSAHRPLVSKDFLAFE